MLMLSVAAPWRACGRGFLFLFYQYDLNDGGPMVTILSMTSLFLPSSLTADPDLPIYE
jgi:hypothetical protein